MATTYYKATSTNISNTYYLNSFSSSISRTIGTISNTTALNSTARYYCYYKNITGLSNFNLDLSSITSGHIPGMSLPHTTTTTGGKAGESYHYTYNGIPTNQGSYIVWVVYYTKKNNITRYDLKYTFIIHYYKSMLLSGTFPNGKINNSYSYKVTNSIDCKIYKTNGSSSTNESTTKFSISYTSTYPDNSYSIIDGSIPPGLTLNTSSGTISGTIIEE